MATWFAMEISGKLGEVRKQRAEKEVEELMKSISDLSIDNHGVARWKTSGHIVPRDCVEKFQYAGLNINAEETDKARQLELAIFLENRQPRRHTSEELSEMRNAFGVGTTVVDVLTGEKIRL